GREHRDLEPVGRPSPQLPLPAAPPDSIELALDAAEPPGGITLELEADEPDSDQPRYQQGGGHHDDEQTGNFIGSGAAPSLVEAAAPPGDIDFADQRSAVPTRELQTPRGFVRPTRAVPPPGDAGDPDEDRLSTRPGRSPG